MRSTVISPSTAIEVHDIRGALAGAIADEQLILHQQRLRSDGSEAAWAEQSHQGDQQVDGQNEEIAHGANRTMVVGARKTAPHGRMS